MSTGPSPLTSLYTLHMEYIAIIFYPFQIDFTFDVVVIQLSEVEIAYTYCTVQYSLLFASLIINLYKKKTPIK